MQEIMNKNEVQKGMIAPRKIYLEANNNIIDIQNKIGDN